MKIIGKVESLWRYPVKSMRGEELPAAFLGFAGVYGDRVYAIRNSAAQEGFPYLTAREQAAMLLHRPVYRCPERMTQPPNLAAARALPPGATPLYASGADTAIDVETPNGGRIGIDDPSLLETLRRSSGDGEELTLLRSDRALTDCRPVSLISIQTVRTLSEEVGSPLDKRRFRANVYIELEWGGGFGEDTLVGRTLRIGSETTITITDRDPRCKMITLDPATGAANPDVMRTLARNHEGKAGVYAAVLAEGTIRPGDEIALLT